MIAGPQLTTHARDGRGPSALSRGQRMRFRTPGGRWLTPFLLALGTAVLMGLPVAADAQTGQDAR